MQSTMDIECFLISDEILLVCGDSKAFFLKHIPPPILTTLFVCISHLMGLFSPLFLVINAIMPYRASAHCYFLKSEQD